MTPSERTDSHPAEPEERWPRLSKADINAHPIGRYDGPIHVIRDPGDIGSAVATLAGETLLGFDIETRPAFRSGQSYRPSVLQLAGEGVVYVFQLRHCGFAAELRGLLADGGIVKAAVAWERDVRDLQELGAFTPAGFVDLGQWAKQLGCNNHGLRGLATLLLGFRISKRAQVSNWARPTLTREQIEYAATDAWVSRLLYLRLQELESASPPLNQPEQSRQQQ